MLKYTLFFILFVTFSYSQDGLIKSISTDKNIYNYGEKVIITTRAINTTQSNYSLVLPSPCNPYPYIDTLNYLAIFEIGCAAVLMHYTIAPNDTAKWIHEYPHSFKPTKYLSVGKHKIYSYFKSNISTSDTIDIEIKSLPTSAIETNNVHNFSLFTIYPNPFNPSTTISFNLPKHSNVLLVISDILGRRIETLIDNPVSSGIHSVRWDPINLSSGLYFCRLIVNGDIEVRILVYSK